jgi:hypothetical protein
MKILSEYKKIILDLRFSRLEFNVKLWLSGVSCVECSVLTNISANIAVAIYSTIDVAHTQKPKLHNTTGRYTTEYVI